MCCPRRLRSVRSLHEIKTSGSPNDEDPYSDWLRRHDCTSSTVSWSSLWWMPYVSYYRTAIHMQRSHQLRPLQFMRRHETSTLHYAEDLLSGVRSGLHYQLKTLWIMKRKWERWSSEPRWRTCSRHWINSDDRYGRPSVNYILFLFIPWVILENRQICVTQRNVFRFQGLVGSFYVLNSYGPLITSQMSYLTILKVCYTHRFWSAVEVPFIHHPPSLRWAVTCVQIYYNAKKITSSSINP